ncbi:hypothetical protein [Ruminococcus flavefaciens]|uniref:hypothetical protein n=1 Tax=Ruminococcus flavefaciens TaxID=1265 RepID=UPI003F04C715
MKAHRIIAIAAAAALAVPAYSSAAENEIWRCLLLRLSGWRRMSLPRRSRCSIS